MKALRKTIILASAFLMALTLLSMNAYAQHARDYLGAYQRTYPSRNGNVMIHLIIRRDHNARATVTFPRGNRVQSDGTWNMGDHRLLQVNINWTGRGEDRVSGTYRLRGNDLQRADDPHIFFKKTRSFR